eukprot:CAMPEP_0172171826 /NCGR_PEP_ID=MMETSP1050-20130122/12107_1 /TAXON_ID=233186 /ORGANISM="Cryptomonas curvata, Strain CCAP979/52" /LENGTH=1269 /DNA_ID=CAMNT_0012843299 /DNA_START=441 /DNA_END=4250 /DNA_ORIENTATION=-
MPFLEQALLSSSLLDPVSTILNSVPALAAVSGNQTLDAVIQKMISSGFEEVAVMDGGVLTFILHIDDIFSYLSKEGVKMGAGVLKKGAVFEGLDESQDGSLSVETSEEVRARLARQSKQSALSPFQLSAQYFCKLYWTEVLLVTCILLDVACTIVDFTNIANDPQSNEKLQVATGIILFVFLYEACVRVFGFRTALLRLPFDVIDLLIVLVSVIIYCLVLRDLLTSDSKSVLTLTRIIRGLRMFKIIRLIFGMLVKQRMMYHQDGFALDLSYITNACIAMSRPAVGSDANFANPIEEVCRFFNTKYPDRYLIFDLCTEVTYGDESFDGRVERIGIEKHNPPRLSQMVGFVERVGKVLDEDPKTCIAVHCKSGRDRTGVMIAAWLLYSRFSESADDAMKWFVSRRISKRAGIGKGIPMVSQQRYVGYMQQALQKGGYYSNRVVLHNVLVATLPKLSSKGSCNLYISVDEGGREVCNSLQDIGVKVTHGDHGLGFELDVPVAGDVRISFYNRDPDLKRDELCCFVCFHTGFVAADREVFAKDAVDIAASDTQCKVFGKNFAIAVEFGGATASNGGNLTPQAGPYAVQRKPSLGKFRRIVRPSQRVIDDAARMRGRDMRVQMSAATRLKRKVFFHSVFKKVGRKGATDEEDADVEAGAADVSESLCCAGGPPVSHDAVDLFQHDGDSAGLQRVATRAFSPSAYIAQSIGARIARSLVSGNKRRFVEDGFDLDLTYVTARVIAMGFPSSGIESSYRNSKADVYRFFQERHAAHYLIVNLCSERVYLLDTFHGNCVRYPFPDHNPPALEMILPCCACIHKFMQADPDNIVAIHCKAGKGRTGLMVVAYLIYCGFRHTAAAAREFYDWARTTDGKGLTITSQIRYTHYFEELLRRIKHGREPVQTTQACAPAILLHRVRLHTVPHFNGDGCWDPFLTIEVKSEKDHGAYPVFRSADRSKSRPPGEMMQSSSSLRSTLDASRRGSCEKLRPSLDAASRVDFIDVLAESLPGIGTRVAGDICLTLHTDEARSKAMCFFWLHSAFLTAPPPGMGGVARPLTDEECAAAGLAPSAWSLVLSKHEIDRAAKDTRCAHFDPDFRAELFFTPLPGERGTGLALDAVREQAIEVSRTDSESGTVEQPLLSDRDAYQRYIDASSGTSRPALTFEEWLLGLDSQPVHCPLPPRHPASLALAAGAVSRAASAQPQLNGREPGSGPGNHGAAAQAKDAGRGQGPFVTDARLEIAGAEVGRGERRSANGEQLATALLSGNASVESQIP